MTKANGAASKAANKKKAAKEAHGAGATGEKAQKGAHRHSRLLA